MAEYSCSENAFLVMQLSPLSLNFTGFDEVRLIVMTPVLSHSASLGSLFHPP